MVGAINPDKSVVKKSSLTNAMPIANHQATITVFSLPVAWENTQKVDKINSGESNRKLTILKAIFNGVRYVRPGSCTGRG